MRQRFAGKSVFITGGSAGIGAALGRAFAAEGARVAVSARRAEKLHEVVEGMRNGGSEAIAVQCDVTDRASIDAAIAQTAAAFGGVDVVVANAGFGVSGEFERLETADYRRQFETNFFGVLDTAYAALPQLIARKGHLAVVSSVFGRVGGPGMSAYCASKFAVCGWAESVYYELAEQGVSITCIEPGVVESDFRITDNAGVFHEGRPDPAPQWIVMGVEKAAAQMVNAIYKRKFEAVITGHGKVAVFASRHFPRTFRAAFRMATKGRLGRIEQRKENISD